MAANLKRNKRHGADTETKFVEWLKKLGVVNAERRHLSGSQDRGDIAGWVKEDGSKKMVVEIKGAATLKLPEWLRELKVEIENDKADMGFVAIRPKGKPSPDNWYYVMSAEQITKLLREAGYLD